MSEAICFCVIFFFQAEDGIRDGHVTGVQTCALPIYIADGTLVFDKGTVDFSPVRNIVPGPPGAEFPPVSAQPGAVGDAGYSPFVQVVNAAGVIYNAPIVAFGVDANQINFPNGNVDYSKVHDEVTAIDPFAQTVT